MIAHARTMILPLGVLAACVLVAVVAMMVHRHDVSKTHDFYRDLARQRTAAIKMAWGIAHQQHRYIIRLERRYKWN